MAIADVYDALISDRPYKRAFSHEEAVDIIAKGRGSHFDPELTDLFLSVSGRFDEAARLVKTIQQAAYI
jgi:putative two-component system response regulator